MRAVLLAQREVQESDLDSRCAICQTRFQAGERLGQCPECSAPFHDECWEENGGCAVYGCDQTPAATAAPPTPASVWGQEERDCPRCGDRIKIAARRCIHCGQTVEPASGPAAPPSGLSSPGMGRAILLFVLGLIPITAPLVLLASGLWLWFRRRQLRRWSPAVRVLLVTGLVTAAAVTLVVAIGLAVHFGRRPALED